jgi:hypothetical protein
MKLMKNNLRNTLALLGAILALSIAVPAFAQGYAGQGYYGGRGEAGWGAYVFKIGKRPDRGLASRRRTRSGHSA